MALLTPENITEKPFQPGDCGIILKENGEFRIFRQHGDIDPNNLTPAQAEQGKKLMALVVALQAPQVMDMLYELAADPAIRGALFDMGKLQ